MTQYKYASTLAGENVARVVGRDLGISTKYSIEICNLLRGKPLAKAKALLEEAAALQKPIPLKRFTNGPGHKRGNLASGRFIVKTASQILSLLNSAEANARNKGLNTKNLVIASILAQKASTPLHYGRQRRRLMKRTHVEVVVQEQERPAPVAKQQPAKAKSTAPQTKKQSVATVVKPAQTKPAKPAKQAPMDKEVKAPAEQVTRAKETPEPTQTK